MNEERLTPQGRQAGAIRRRGQPWQLLPIELPDHLYRQLCTAPDRPNRTHFSTDTWTAAFPQSNNNNSVGLQTTPAETLTLLCDCPCFFDFREK